MVPKSDNRSYLNQYYVKDKIKNKVNKHVSTDTEIDLFLGALYRLLARGFKSTMVADT